MINWLFYRQLIKFPNWAIIFYTYEVVFAWFIRLNMYVWRGMKYEDTHFDHLLFFNYFIDWKMYHLISKIISIL